MDAGETKKVCSDGGILSIRLILRYKRLLSTHCGPSASVAANVGMAIREPLRIIELTETDITGLQKAWRISRLVAELDHKGMAERELGYDDLGRLVHRWPGGESFASHGLLDLAVFEASGRSDMSAAEFETLWNEAIDEERFFAENDPFGDRFGASIPWWGCLGILGVAAGAAYYFFA